MQNDLSNAEIDIQLLKENKIETLLKKYNTLIKNVSYKQYNSMAENLIHDSSIDSEEIYQKNMILAWQAARYIQKRINKGIHNKEISFWMPLKQRLNSYHIAKINKKRDKINQDTESIDTVNDSRSDNIQFPKKYRKEFKSKQDFVKEIETTELHDKFVKQLTKEEKKFIEYLEMYDASCSMICKKTGIEISVCNKMKRKLKYDFKNFLKKEGYKI